jgi:hypothetical protein
MEKQIKRVIVKEISSKGHDEWDFDAQEALEYIQEAARNGKWLYLDGTFANPNEVTLDDLAESRNILLSNALIGGNAN